MSGADRAETMVCRVCGGSVDETNSALCNGCGERFHLNRRNDREGKDCGGVWLNEQYLALEFGCFMCLEGATRDTRHETGEPPVGSGH